MEQDKIAILMSTYNGERYLREQIESIQKQTNNNWHLYIRDDGSNDKTASIISKFANSDDRITFFNEENICNVGVIRSFMDLLKNVDADFYMFSDQDDIWKRNKIQRALDLITKEKYPEIPLCLHTELQVVNDDLKPIELMKRGRVWDDFLHFLFGNCVTGCTVMINQKLKEKLRIDLIDLNKIAMHDWWFAEVASAFGKVIYDPNPTILYRQHIDNVVGGTDSQAPQQLVQRFFNLSEELNGFLLMAKMASEFQRLYNGEITGKNAEYVRAYANLSKDSSFTNNLKLALKLPPVRSHLRGQLLLDYLMIRHPNKFLHS
ncbi:glycosyltransferase family 2 protein [Limosilactobacillus reuteri]|uniref:glycosyltransferase family 2 protein n=1 Tax=Limosilactobacillus reuteri TaxID=1598 RepID=UPI001E529F25|nr:glycosyltransferase family 2 protein [Limosilactobacillus reuteri]MCC4328502.1 glycosyltransferase family 2 protein [Limosilactobacillus reuteri]MCC4336643.1 glycosyltransferase family 2 protein [Limosilactobacillus reuteri]MCC4338542.1 glycosyltransferase family 2 protein [Limosilactobacillus reuteri]